MSSQGPYNRSPGYAGKQIGVSIDTIKRWAERGHLAGIKTPGGWWRFSDADIADFLARHAITDTEEVTA